MPNTVSRQLYLESFAYLIADLAEVEMVGLPLEESIKGMAFRGEVAPFLSTRPSAAVIRALDEAEEQLARYLADPRLAAFAGSKGWRSVAVACVGTQALYFRQPGQEICRVPT